MGRHVGDGLDTLGLVHVSVQRGGDFEQTSGKTLDEVFSQLEQLTRLDTVGGCP